MFRQVRRRRGGELMTAGARIDASLKRVVRGLPEAPRGICAACSPGQQEQDREHDRMRSVKRKTAEVTHESLIPDRGAGAPSPLGSDRAEAQFFRELAVRGGPFQSRLLTKSIRM